MSVEAISIIVALVLTGLAAVSLVLFGIRNLFYGKQEVSSILFGAIPLVIFVALGLTGMTWAVAGIWTVLIMLALAGVGLLLSSVRGLIGM